MHKIKQTALFSKVQEAPKAPPPPPPAPPKMESKAEPVVKKEETSSTKAVAAAATKAEGSAKSKTKDSALSKLFRSKVSSNLTAVTINHINKVFLSGSGVSLGLLLYMLNLYEARGTPSQSNVNLRCC